MIQTWEVQLKVPDDDPDAIDVDDMTSALMDLDPYATVHMVINKTPREAYPKERQ